GYVGTGVATTNLAGRTLTELILARVAGNAPGGAAGAAAGAGAALSELPWVNHRVRNWEPEPLRWLAVTGLYRAYGIADRAEHGGRRTTTSPLATIADRVSGRGH
ncbi:hypothetical protein QN357_19105, partial [Cryobacterium sp. RTC2.1]|nr:hypothetical protein [Cryobacterium sp. RTC2.1]